MRILSSIVLVIMAGTLALITYMNQETVQNYQNTISGYKAIVERKDSLYKASVTMYKGHIAFRDSIISRQNYVIHKYEGMADNQIKFLKKANQDAQNRINAYRLR